MNRSESERAAVPAGFLACPPRSAKRRESTARLGARGTFLVMPARVVDSLTAYLRVGDRTLALLISMAIALAVIPEIINFLLVKRPLDASPLESMGTETAVASLARWALSGALLAVASAVMLMRGHPNRDITRLLVILVALNLAYVVGPKLPGPADFVKIVLANVVILAIWNTGARVAELKWIPIIVSVVAAYSIVGGLLIPEYMMYNIPSRKAIVLGWELAGPFGHSNVLGNYCAVAFTLLPLIVGLRWRVLCGSILLAAISLSASRTALIAASLVLLFWALCRIQSVVSVRTFGTVLASLSLTSMAVVPFLNWHPTSFTGRAEVWAESLHIWQQAPLVGVGFNWYLIEAQVASEITVWAFVGTGHNLVIDTLTRYGLAGLAVLAPMWIIAIVATRALRATNEQMAFFGYLMAFFLAATTEALWDLWPNISLFPISGLIFIVLVLARDDKPAEGSS